MVVFIPPAVEPGLPPMSIRTIRVIFPASDIAASSTVLAPAVLGVTAWNKDARIRSFMGRRVNSKKKKPIAGIRISSPVVTRITLLCIR